MPSLREIQHALAAHIVANDGPPLEPWIRVPEGSDLAARVAVYTDGYPARLIEALRETFPAFANILGDGSLESLCDRYRQALRDTPVNLNDVGADLPQFLQTDRLREQLAFLPDLAELEWRVTRAFHARLVAAFDPSACADWDLAAWQRARIVFQPGVALLRSSWPLRALHATRHQDRDDIDVDLEQGGECVLVFRRGFEVVVEAVDPLEAEAIDAFGSGATLDEVSERLAREGAAEDAVVGLFRGWVSKALIASVRVAD